MNKNAILNSVISATAGGILGGAVTYITVKKTLEARSEERLQAEIEDVKTRYALLRKEEPGSNVVNYYSDMAVDKARAMEIAKEMGYLTAPNDDETESEDEPHETAQTLSVFDVEVPVDEDGVPIPEEDEDDGFENEDPEEEDEDEVSDDDAYVRIDGEPYLIDINDFFNNNDDHDKVTLIYYEDDDVVTEQDESMMDNVEQFVGRRHLHMFGPEHDQDEDTIYVRNDEINTDYEINRVNGSYSSIVLGVREDLLDVKPRKKSPGRMRDDD